MIDTNLLKGKSARQIIDAIPRMIELLHEQGLDFRRPAQKIAQAVLPLVQDEPLQDRILRLYDQLDRLDPSEDSVETNYLLDRLHDLEQQEADQYARAFDAWRPLKEGALDAALEHARALLKK